MFTSQKYKIHKWAAVVLVLHWGDLTKFNNIMTKPVGKQVLDRLLPSAMGHQEIEFSTVNEKGGALE